MEEELKLIKVKVTNISSEYEGIRVVAELPNNERRILHNPLNIMPDTFEEIYVTEEHKEIVPYKLYKADIWRRATDQEIIRILEALNNQPIKLQMIFKDALFINVFDEMFPLLKTIIVSLFGTERAEELLRPSDRQ